MAETMTAEPALGRARRTGPPPKALKQVVAWLITVGIVAAWFTGMRPQALGGPTAYVGVSGHSMLPTLHQGDLTIVKRHAHYKVGDIVAYTIPKGEAGAGLKIIHRIVGGDGQHGYVTQGDNNGYTDVWHPTDHQVVGRVSMRLPGVAGLLSKLRQPRWLALIVFVTTFLIVVLPEGRTKKDEDVGSANPLIVGTS